MNNIKKTFIGFLSFAVALFLPFVEMSASSSAFAQDIKSVENAVKTEKISKEVYVSGESIGIAMITDGLVVTKVTEVKELSKRRVYPAADAGIRPGDIIIEFNNVKIKDSEQISKLVAKNGGNTASIKVLRNGDPLELKITPSLDAQSSEYKLGVLVRDSTSGIGTLTYIDPDTMSYGALGHAITDVSTGVILSAADGSISNALINNVVKGKAGKPGELQGTFSLRNPIGNIKINNELGMFGKINDSSFLQGKKLIRVAEQSEIKIGEAEILCSIDETGINSYKINIIKLTSQNSPDIKGMVIEVTDERLISKTGGIVQGMSGSPIIQNGCLVGAVTHVMVNNPKKGYGIFAEWMISESDKVS